MTGWIIGVIAAWLVLVALVLLFFKGCGSLDWDDVQP